MSHSNPVRLVDQISICATKKDADLINYAAMEKLTGNPVQYIADYEGVISDADLQVETSMILKVGMRVMSVVNGIGYSNGSLGTVVSLDQSYVEVLFDNNWKVCFGKRNFTVDRRDIPGKTTDVWQIPIRPAYAITIHKSQGQTFQYVNIDGTRCWAPGQLYVAVSLSLIHILKLFYEERSSYLAVLIRLMTGISLRESSALLWRNFQYNKDTDVYTLSITKFVDNSGKLVSHALEESWEKYRTLPISMFLGKIIEERKEFLMRKGIAAEVLDEYPIVLGREDFNNILKGHRSEFCKPAFIAQKCRESISKAEIVQHMLVLPDEENGAELELSLIHIW